MGGMSPRLNAALVLPKQRSKQMNVSQVIELCSRTKLKNIYWNTKVISIQQGKMHNV